MTKLLKYNCVQWVPNPTESFNKMSNFYKISENLEDSVFLWAFFLIFKNEAFYSISNFLLIL